MARLDGMSGLLSAALMLIFCCGGVQCYKILVAVSMPAKSHHNLGKGIADILHDRGHEITFLTSFPSSKPQYKEIGLPEVLEFKTNVIDESLSIGKTNSVSVMFNMGSWMATMSGMVLNNSDVSALLNSKTEQFDLVILEYFANEALIGFGVHFDCPVIMLSPVTMLPSLAVMTGNLLSPATVPSLFTPYTVNMNLWQRTVNTALVMFQLAAGRISFLPGQEEQYLKHLPDEAAKVPFSELNKKIALVLCGTHVSLDGPRPLLPNTIEIGGYHIGEIEPLPEDLQKLLDNAKYGVILFSMGSNSKSSTMTAEMKTAILNTLGKLKQTVIWKYEEDLPGKPRNVIIKKWLPQLSILAHKNVKFFLTHGGLLSRTEAIKAGVPLIVMPVGGDQQHNAQVTEEMGHGLQMHLSNLTEDSLSWAIQEMLTNPRYDQQAKKLAKLFLDRPVSPKDLVIFYTEHVIRTNGAAHLSAPLLGRLQLMLVDVILVMLLPVVTLLIVTLLLCKRCTRGKKRPVGNGKSDKKKNN